MYTTRAYSGRNGHTSALCQPQNSTLIYELTLSLHMSLADGIFDRAFRRTMAFRRADIPDRISSLVMKT